MISTQPNITDQTALEILQGASELFMKYGVKSITMDEIARHLSVSKKTIYQHFADKDELVITFTRVVLQQQQAEICSLDDQNLDVMEGLFGLSEFMRTKVCNINQSLLFDLKKYFPAAWKIFTDHKRNFLKNHIKNFITRGVKEGYFRSNVDIEIISRMRMEQVEMCFNQEIFPVEEFGMSAIHMQLFEHFVYGICTLKGHEKLDTLYNNAKSTTK
jgi:AcrR family transcriptional regulator